MAQTLTKIYSDIDFTFTKKPVTADVALSYDAQAVIRSIRNLVRTNHYDRLFNSGLGNNLNSLLFEPVSTLTSVSIESEIRTMINTYEPRAILEAVDVKAETDNNRYSISVTFYLENATLPTTTTILLERIR